VANQVITESQIDDEVRLTEFLNQEPLNLDPAEKKKAAARLIEQALVREKSTSAAIRCRNWQTRRSVCQDCRALQNQSGF